MKSFYHGHGTSKQMLGRNKLENGVVIYIEKLLNERKETIVLFFD
jgi:hypothetical protein